MIPVSILPQHWFLAVAALLTLLPASSASPQEASSVPTRGLAHEMAEMKQGAPAYIHTHFATGAGFVLQSGDEVLTARHNVLTPEGELSPEVGVGIPQPPLNNIVERHAIPVAQDPTEDLVLLRLTGGPVEQVSPSTPAYQAVTAFAAAVPCNCSNDARQGRVQRESQVLRARLRRMDKASMKRIVPVRAVPPGQTAKPTVTRIVWDGPATANASRLRAPKPPATQARVRIVWDGPLRH